MSSGSSIIASISSNLSNTYSYLASLYPEEGVTYKNITAARNDNTNYLTLNQPFATYLQNRQAKRHIATLRYLHLYLFRFAITVQKSVVRLYLSNADTV